MYVREFQRRRLVIQSITVTALVIGVVVFGSLYQLVHGNMLYFALGGLLYMLVFGAFFTWLEKRSRR